MLTIPPAPTPLTYYKKKLEPFRILIERPLKPMKCDQNFQLFLTLPTPPHMPVCPDVFRDPRSHGSKCFT